MATASSSKVPNNSCGLTEEEIEELLNKKIEQIRRKNEETMKKHKLREEDRQMAEKSGRSVTLHLNCTSKKVHNDELRANVTSSGAYTSEAIAPGTNNSPRSKDDDKSQLMCLKDTETTRRTETKQRFKKHPVTSPKTKDLLPHPVTSPKTEDVLPNPIASPKTKDVLECPPPDPCYNFLADRTRDGCDSQEKSSNRRHHRNFGGNSFENAALKVQHNNDRKDFNPVPSVLQSKMEYQLATTGKERLEYAKWKSEQDKIDQARLRRHINDAGEWRREWDRNKVNLESEDSVTALSISQNAEANRRSEHRLRRNEDSRPVSKQLIPINDLRSRVVETTRNVGVKLSNETFVPSPDRRRVKISNPRRRPNAVDASKALGNNGSSREDGEMKRKVGSGRLSLAYDGDGDQQVLINDTRSSRHETTMQDGDPQTTHRRQNRRGKLQSGRNLLRKNSADIGSNDLGCGATAAEPRSLPNQFLGAKKNRRGRLTTRDFHRSENAKHRGSSVLSDCCADQTTSNHVETACALLSNVEVVDGRELEGKECGVVDANEGQTPLKSQGAILFGEKQIDFDNETGDKSIKLVAESSSKDTSDTEPDKNSDDEDEWEDVENDDGRPSDSDDEMADKFEDSLCDLEIRCADVEVSNNCQEEESPK